MQNFPRPPSLEGRDSPRIPPDQYSEKHKAVHDEVEDRPTEPPQPPQVGGRNGLISSA